MLARANRELEVLRWLLRMAEARRLLTARQYRFACVGLEECERMLGGWLRQASSPRGPAGADDTASIELHSTLTPLRREALDRPGLTVRV